MNESKNYIPALKYDWLTKIYDPVLQLTMPERKFKMALIQQMNIQAEDRILDFGCGSLTLSIMAASANPYSEIFGVDVDEKILSIANQKLEKMKLNNISARLYNGTTLPYPDKHFDKVMSSLVFHHLNERQKYAAIAEINRVLKPLGELYIADFGKPDNAFQRMGFYGVQLLDGFETTNDSLKDILQKAISQQSFTQVMETGKFRTLVGTVRLLKAVKTYAGT